MKHNDIPLLDVDALYSLEDSLGGQTVLSYAFVFRYVQMWPQRFERIHNSVSTGRWDDALDAALSLYSSSGMAGAPRLSRHSANLVQLLKDNKQLEAARMLAELRRCGDQTVAELAASYLSPQS